MGDLNPTVAQAVASFTRPADTTAYASGDLVANSTTAGSVVPLSVSTSAVRNQGVIRRARLYKTGTSVTNSAFRVHLFEGTLPTVTNGDNGAFAPSGLAGYIGAFDVASMIALGDGAKGFGVPLVGTGTRFKLVTKSVLYALIEARGAYTPASGEIFSLDLEIEPNN